MSESKTFIDNVEREHNKVINAFDSLLLLSGVERERLISLMAMYEAHGMTYAAQRVQRLLPLLDQFVQQRAANQNNNPAENMRIVAPNNDDPITEKTTNELIRKREGIMSDHYLKVVSWYNDESPRLGLVCEAAPDAPCRMRSAGDDRKTWNADNQDLEPGHECWAVEWVENNHWEDAVRAEPRAKFARIPVAVEYDEGVYLTPAPDNKECGPTRQKDK